MRVAPKSYSISIMRYSLGPESKLIFLKDTIARYKKL